MFTLFTMTIYSQLIADEYGIITGVNGSRLGSTELVPGTAIIGGSIGIFREHKLNDLLSIVGEVNYIQKGNERDDNLFFGSSDESTYHKHYSYTERLNYLEIPIFLKLRIANSNGIYAGYFYSKLIDSDKTVPYGTPNESPNISRYESIKESEDHGFVYGFMTNVDPTFSFDLRFIGGTNGIFDSKTNNQTLLFSARKIISTDSIAYLSTKKISNNWSIKTGGTMSDIVGGTEIFDHVNGHHIGIGKNFMITNSTSYTIELNWIQKGFKKMDSYGDVIDTLINISNSIEIPLILKQNIGLGFNIYAGGYYSKLIESSYLTNTLSSDKIDITETLAKDNLGVIIGASYMITPDFELEIRYNQGLTPIEKQSYYFNRTVSFGINKAL